jgi:hypothetical protein
MSDYQDSPVLIVASAAELPAHHRVWGTGGWLPPEQREALDWLTLSRLLGWGVQVSHQTSTGFDKGLADGSRWMILACDPDGMTNEQTALLQSRLATEPLLVVARAGVPSGPWARLAGASLTPQHVQGRVLRWAGPGTARQWHCRNPLVTTPLTISMGTAAWAMLDSAPVIAARQVGRGIIATLGFHPSHARDLDGAATALLKHLLIWGSSYPVAWLDLEGTIVLRMDDPGGAQNVYLESWCYPKLGEPEWAAIGADLSQRKARISLGYVSGWVDDGDVERGLLELDGRAAGRVPGQIHSSPSVRYYDRAGHTPGIVHDYEAEYRGIQALRTAGRGDVELHGYTHLHPDTTSWAAAPDRYEAVSWYRELGSAATAIIATRPPHKHPLSLGVAALRRLFDVRPTTLICPGDEWTDAVLGQALDLGLQLVSSYYLALREGERFCWTQHVCAPYLDEPDAAWFDSGLPIVGYFHDYEPAVKGVGWMRQWLDRWQEAGARRLVDFRELAAAIGRRIHLQQCGGAVRLAVTGASAPPLVRPLPIGLHFPGGRLPSEIAVDLDGGQLVLDVQPLSDGVSRLVLPCSSETDHSISH